jgi:hypothetical protein
MSTAGCVQNAGKNLSWIAYRNLKANYREHPTADWECVPDLKNS